MVETVCNWGRINHDSIFGAYLSGLGNMIMDYFKGVFDSKIKSSAKGSYEDAEKQLKTTSDVNAFLIHNYRYTPDVNHEDNWRNPEDFFNHRGKDGKIEDDCEGTAWFAHHITKVNGDNKDNYVFCMYNDNEGHATNSHGKLTDKEKIAKYFISDANWYGIMEENNGNMDILESGPFELDAHIKAETRENLEKAISKYGIGEFMLLNVDLDILPKEAKFILTKEFESLALSMYIDGDTLKIDTGILDRYIPRESSYYANNLIERFEKNKLYGNLRKEIYEIFNIPERIKKIKVI